MKNIERYEQKFLVSPRKAEELRRLIAPYCQPDSATRQGPYLVLSLYFDGDHLPFYRATQANESMRLKLRARTYNGESVYLEIKRKIRGMVWKSRARLSHASWVALFEQRSLPQSVRRDHLGLLGADELKTYEEFIYWRDRHHAIPQAWVGYTREGYQSLEENYARVTFDTEIQGALPQGHTLPQFCQQRALHWRHLDYSDKLKNQAADVVIELKAERSVPDWMSELSRHLSVCATGVSKYVLAIEQLHPGYLRRQRDYLSGLTCTPPSWIFNKHFNQQSN